MKKIKTKIKDFFSTLIAWIVILLPLWVLIAVLGIGYVIASSDLPDWFKFFLLK